LGIIWDELPGCPGHRSFIRVGVFNDPFPFGGHHRRSTIFRLSYKLTTVINRHAFNPILKKGLL
jgi:hypothetical protein